MKLDLFLLCSYHSFGLERRYILPSTAVGFNREIVLGGAAPIVKILKDFCSSTPFKSKVIAHFLKVYLLCC